MALPLLSVVVATCAFEVEPWYKNLAHFGPLDRDYDAGKLSLYLLHIRICRKGAMKPADP